MHSKIQRKCVDNVQLLDDLHGDHCCCTTCINQTGQCATANEIPKLQCDLLHRRPSFRQRSIGHGSQLVVGQQIFSFQRISWAFGRYPQHSSRLRRPSDQNTFQIPGCDSLSSNCLQPQFHSSHNLQAFSLILSMQPIHVGWEYV